MSDPNVKRILIVEDSETIKKIMKLGLRILADERGVKLDIVFASDFEDGDFHLLQGGFYLVSLDCELDQDPNGDGGPRLLARIEEGHYNSSPGVVMVYSTVVAFVEAASKCVIDSKAVVAMNKNEVDTVDWVKAVIDLIAPRP